MNTSLAVCDDEAGEGTWQLTLVPPLPQTETHTPRDIVFILDHSGSMDGWKLVAARRAVARMVDTLTPRDRFSALAFASEVSWPMSAPASALIAATDYNRFQAISFLSGLEACGGTEMAQPLHLAANILNDSDSGRERIIVLATDGQIGNEDHLLRLLAQHLPQVRIFALGIDRSVNAGFLERLAALGDGACELVESEERLDDAMDRMHRRIATPIYTDLSLEAEGLELSLETTTPTRFPVLFDGTPVVVSGRYRQRTPAAQLTLHATDISGRVWSETVPAMHANNPSLTTHWARGHVRDLEDQYLLSNRSQRAHIESRIIDISLRFGVLSRFTAFVAVDRTEQVIIDGHRHRVTQAVELPSGWHRSQPIMHGLAQTAFMTSRDATSAQALPYSTAPSTLPYASPLAADVSTPIRPTPWMPSSHDDTSDWTPDIPGSLYRPAIWRRRASELAQQAGREPLSKLAEQLEGLLAQLRTQGINSADINPLANVLRDLRAHLAGTRQDQTIAQRIQTALYAFSEGQPSVEPSARRMVPQTRLKTFWKAL